MGTITRVKVSGKWLNAAGARVAPWFLIDPIEVNDQPGVIRGLSEIQVEVDEAGTFEVILAPGRYAVRMLRTRYEIEVPSDTRGGLMSEMVVMNADEIVDEEGGGNA